VAAGPDPDADASLSSDAAESHRAMSLTTDCSCRFQGHRPRDHHDDDAGGFQEMPAKTTAAAVVLLMHPV